MDNPDELSLAQDVIHMPMRYETAKKRALVEVFAVRIVGEPPGELKYIRGLIMLRGSDRNHVIYEHPFDKKRGPQYNSEGYFTLIGPIPSLEVKDELVIYPWLFRNGNALSGRNKGKILWKRDTHFPRTDQVIRKGIASNVGLMEVDFAVYDDGVEAHIEISLLGLELEGVLGLEKLFEIYGSVKASNSVVIHSGARSTLFDHTSSWGPVKLSPGPSGEAGICVPLTKSVTVIPRDSNLIVDVDLSLIILQGKSLAVGSVTFNARSRSSCTVEEKIILGTGVMVKVKAIWSA